MQGKFQLSGINFIALTYHLTLSAWWGKRGRKDYLNRETRVNYGRGLHLVQASDKPSPVELESGG